MVAKCQQMSTVVVSVRLFDFAQHLNGIGDHHTVVYVPDGQE